MKTFKYFIIILTFIPLLIIMILAMPFALVGAVGIGIMNWVQKTITELGKELEGK